MAVIELSSRQGTRYKVVYRDAAGKQAVAGTYGTKREANAAYTKAKAGALKGQVHTGKATNVYPLARGSKGTIAAYAVTWLPNHALQAHSRETYQAVLDAQILPVLGSKAVAEITVADVKGLFRKMEDAGKTSAYIAKTKTVLSAMLQTAAEDPKSGLAFNPARGVRFGGKKSTRRSAVTPDEFDRFLTKIGAHYRLLCEVITGSGIRWEEAMALCSTSVEGDYLVVAHVLEELHKPLRFVLRDGTKNGKARRVKIDHDLAERLRALPDGFLFTRPDGKHIGGESFRKTTWYPALEAAGLPNTLVPRDMRRCHATWLRDGKADISVISARLGHSSVAVTDRYLAEQADVGDDALAALQRARTA